MRCLYPAIILLGLALGCRSIVKPKASVLFEGPDVAMDKGIPLALGNDYSCILNREGQGLCLGSQAASPPPPARWQTLHAVGSRPELKHLVARGSVACAVGVSPPSLENRVLCWQPDRSRSPARVDQDAILFSNKLPAPIRSLSLQKNKVCALFVDGQVGCADLSSSERTLKISLVKGLRSIRSLRSGDGFSCGVRGDGAIFCWGENSQGQLGLGSSFVAEDEPAAIANFSGYALAVEAGTQHACGINQAGEVFCWGRNSEQQLAVEGAKHVDPQLVMGLPAKATALALGERHSCAQLVGGSVWCWGAREALGSDTHGGLIPVRVPLPTPSSMLVASSDRSCAQLTNGRFFCWGEEPELFNVPP